MDKKVGDEMVKSGFSKGIKKARAKEDEEFNIILILHACQST